MQEKRRFFHLLAGAVEGGLESPELVHVEAASVLERVVLRDSHDLAPDLDLRRQAGKSRNHTQTHTKGVSQDFTLY